MIWFTSDNHFFHKKMTAIRGFASPEEMNEALIANWNRVVKPTDTVYNLGDFSFTNLAKTKEIKQRLNGVQTLILGNHDEVLYKKRKELVEEGVFKAIHKDLEIRYEGQIIVLHHFAKRVWNRSHHGSIHLFGHSHGFLPPLGKSVDVGIDSPYITEEFRPVSIHEVLGFFLDRPVHDLYHKIREQTDPILPQHAALVASQMADM